MFEIDKGAFGAFLAEQRKIKGYTQKELAGKLFVSDKAVSKWERGLSMPDISLLVPLAEILGVTVTELLEGRRMDHSMELDTERVEIIVKKALALSGESPEKTAERKRRLRRIFAVCVLAAITELAGAWCFFRMTGEKEIFLKLMTADGLLLLFGTYICFFIKEKLPTYYDENRIHTYSDGIFRMNMPGMNLNNSNWPCLVKVLRIWLLAGIIAAPVICVAVYLLPVNGDLRNLIWKIISMMCVAGMFLSIYIACKKS